MAANKIIRTATVAMSLKILLKGQLKFLSQYYEVVAVSGNDADLDAVKKNEGVSVVPVTMKRSIAPFYDLISLYRLYKLFKKERPIIVHSITPKAGLLSMMAAKYANVPIRIHTFTGLVFPAKKGLFRKILILMDKVLCWHATHIIPEGEGVKNDLIANRVTSKPLQVLANGNVNGIDTAFFNPDVISKNQQQKLKDELQITNADFVFIFVGRLVGDKGINELVQAFSKLCSSSNGFENTKLLLVGPFETDLDPLLPETLEQLESNENIISVGFQNDVRPYFAISHVLVFPSYREGFPNVVMQAGAMGLPAIVTDINGCNEIIVQNNNGIIIPEKNTSAIFDAMKMLRSNPELYFQLKNNSRQMITTRYEQQMVWEAILKAYQKFEQDV